MAENLRYSVEYQESPLLLPVFVSCPTLPWKEETDTELTEVSNYSRHNGNIVTWKKSILQFRTVVEV